MKRTILKDYVSYTLYVTNVMLVLLNIMLLAELNTCYLFYSISINIVILNTYIIKHFGSNTFNRKYMNIFTDNEERE